MTRLSVLDLAPIRQGGTAAEAYAATRAQARHVEGLGFHRYWLAEHHNMPGVGSSATTVLIGHVAGATETIRVGSGGVMLPNHTPLVVAEQFGTLASLYPGRIDLGLGRAPGTDPRTIQALRRDRAGGPEQFPRDVQELQAWFRAAEPGQAVRAVPGAGLEVPIWILGSSPSSAQLAAKLGLPYAFASHFAPGHLMEALELYRARFEPSAQLERPYVMLGINVLAADSGAEAAHLFTSTQQQFCEVFRGRPGPLPPPVEDMDRIWSRAEKAGVMEALRHSAVGGPDRVARDVAAFVEATGADELMVHTLTYDPRAALRSFELLARAHAGAATA
ncbi:MAG: LLM class flavin-dependent oxidoreductase [Halofilum sp. (in: g-proteobacteria)]|nr:LLM class flavin-dependent oxidoreductase [Halofilum sp. (in: g-proteobacteria)]